MSTENLDDYPFEVRHLTAEEGGGYLVTYPDFNVCMSDGETIEEAMMNGRDALRATIESLKEGGFPVPAPGAGPASGKFIARVPKSIHAQLTHRAKTEGVSLNMLVLSFIAEGLGRQQGPRQRGR